MLRPLSQQFSLVLPGSEEASARYVMCACICYYTGYKYTVYSIHCVHTSSIHIYYSLSSY